MSAPPSRWARAAIAVLVVPLLALTACSGERPDPLAPLDVPRGLSTTTPGHGDVDTVTWNLGTGEPASLDWITAYDDSGNTTLANMCEGLMRQNPDMSLSPALAERVDHPNPTTTVFTVRDGVRFWDGSPLTAADVVYSLKRHLDPAAGSYWGVPFYDNVSAIEQTGSREVTVRFKQPDALFERMLSTAAGIIGSKAYTERAGKAYGTAKGGIMCTGPFAYVSWQPGSKIVMQRNPDYWDAALEPKVRKLELTFVTDETTIANSLVSGGIDGTYNPPLSATELLARSDSGSLVLGESTDWMAIRPTEVEGPMRKLQVRQALSLILDRDAIAAAVYRGTATPSLSPVQPGAWGYARETWKTAAAALPKPEFDIAAAKKLIADAGLTGTRISIAIPADSEAESKVAEIMEAGARKAGLVLEFHRMPQTSFTELYFDAKARAPFDAFIVQEYGAGVADPIVTMSEFTPLSAYDYGAYDDPVLTRSVAQAMVTPDPEARAKLLIAGERRMVEDLPLINIVNASSRVYQNSRITGATASRALLYYPWAAKIGAAK